MDSLSAHSDADLAALTLRRNPDAYAELVRRYQNSVYNIAYRLVGEKQEALDLAQEAFIHAYDALASFDRARPFAPWIHRIVTNLALNHLERRRVSTIPLDNTQAPATELPLPDQSGDPERMYLVGEQQEAVRHAILKLPPRYRVVIELRHFQELSYAEIAAALGIPESDVKSNLFRARQMLREYLQNV